jgi:NADP-dependent 3-hydroxy acid dehydrogenase YdfG
MTHSVNNSVKGKVAVVTGAAAGLGRENLIELRAL